MKIKYKLSLMGISTMIFVVLITTFVQTNRASTMSRNLSIQTMSSLNNELTEYWNGQINSHIRVLTTLANIMARYENFQPEARRLIYNELLRDIIEAEPVFFELNTVWMPNRIDGMDAQMIGTPGSTITGQFASAFAREGYEGAIVHRTTPSVPAMMEHIFQGGIHSMRHRVENPVRSIVQDNYVYLVRISVPIISQNGEVIGMVSCQLDIGTVQESVMLKISEHPELAAISVYANDGFIIGSSTAENIGLNLNQMGGMFGGQLDDIMRAVRAGIGDSFQGHSPALGANMVVNLNAFPIGNSGMTWTVLLAKNERDIMSPIWNMVVNSVIIAAIIIAIAAILSIIFYNYMTKPISVMQSALKRVANGDLTSRADVKSKDEIGELASHLNETVDKVKSLIFNIKKEAATLSEIGHTLSSNMDETAATVNEIVSTIQSIKGRVISQSASVHQTNATMEQLLGNINSLGSNVEKQSEHVSGTSSAIEEMAANIRSVTDTLVKNASSVKDLMEASEIGRSGLSEVVDDIQVIARESEDILEINAVMENIASQTNLLSMNAAIEAAHAGDAGRGFAVVADEIRKLAENSSEQSKTIGGVLKNVKNSVDKIINSTNNVLSRFETIESGIKTVAFQEESIRCSMEEQEVGSRHIVNSVLEITEITREVKDSSDEMFNGAKEVIKESAALEMVSEELSSNMNEMVAGAEQINAAIHHVNDISQNNRQAIGLLLDEVSRFKVE